MSGLTQNADDNRAHACFRQRDRADQSRGIPQRLIDDVAKWSALADEIHLERI